MRVSKCDDGNGGPRNCLSNRMHKNKSNRVPIKTNKSRGDLWYFKEYKSAETRSTFQSMLETGFEFLHEPPTQKLIQIDPLTVQRICKHMEWMWLGGG